MRTPIDTAVIMAGGQGMRLRPYTTVLPKPLMPLGDRPLLEILIRQLGAAGIRRAVISVNHLAHIVRAVLDHIHFDDIDIEYVYEDAPLGTCGALGLMRERLPERFVVVNGDLLSDYPIARLLARHCASEALLTVGTRVARQPLEFGVIRRDAAGRVCDYVEKPPQEHELSIGLYAIERDSIDRYLQPGMRVDTPDVIRRLLADGQPVAALPADCTWIDIGHAEQYLRAQEWFEREPERFLDANAIQRRDGSRT